MEQQPALSIIGELEDAVNSGSPAKRVATLRQVTDLFMHGGERLVRNRSRSSTTCCACWSHRVETRARAELSKRLAPVDYAPFDVIEKLASDDAIEVAGEVLTHSSRLGTEALVRIASTKGQDHLMAISARADLPEAVTDVIVDRGEGNVIRQLANNASAKFSEAGYSGIVARADGDDRLTEILGLRIDLPVKFLRDLLRRAKDAVRDRLLAIAPRTISEEIRRVLDDIAKGSARQRLRATSVSPNSSMKTSSLKLILTMSPRDWQQITGRNPALTTALQRLNVAPLPHNETMNVMEGAAIGLEHQSGVTITYQAVKEVTLWPNAIWLSRLFPGGA